MLDKYKNFGNEFNNKYRLAVGKSYIKSYNLPFLDLVDSCSIMLGGNKSENECLILFKTIKQTLSLLQEYETEKKKSHAFIDELLSFCNEFANSNNIKIL